MTGDGTAPQRWDALLADLAAELDAEADRELAGEVADRIRRERARVRLVDRLRAAVGRSMRVATSHGVLHGALTEVGADWLLLGEAATQVLVPMAAVVTVDGLGRAEEPGGEGPVAARLTLAIVLRRFARDRARVQVDLTGSTSVRGRIDVVGADYLDVQPEGADARRRTLAIAAVVSVRRL